MQAIQLPTSTGLLGAALIRHFEFVVNTDVEKERRENDPFSLKGLLYADFDKDAEIQRLLNLATALDSGVKTLRFA